MLWKITENAESTPSYLLGTVHILDKHRYPISIFDHVFECENYVCEVDLNEDTSLFKKDNIQSLMKKMVMKINEMSEEEFNSFEPIEISLMKMNHWKNVVALEEFSDQINIINKMSPVDADCSDLIVDSSIKFIKDPEEFIMLLPNKDRWELFDKRNIKMFEKMLGELEAGGRFVTIGLGHMYGPNGILNLLKLNGFEVEQVSSYEDAEF